MFCQRVYGCSFCVSVKFGSGIYNQLIMGNGKASCRVNVVLYFLKCFLLVKALFDLTFIPSDH